MHKVKIVRTQPLIGIFAGLLLGAVPAADATTASLQLLLLSATNESSGAQQSLPLKTGEVFVVDSFDFKVTRNDMGFDFFSGNMGEINSPEPTTGQTPIVTGRWSTESHGSVGGSWALDYSFSGYPADAVCGCFLSLFGLTETLVELDGTGIQPAHRTAFTNNYINFNNVFDAFLPWAGRSLEIVAFDARLAAGSPAIRIKVELKDEHGCDVYTRRDVTATNWVTLALDRSAFNQSIRTNINLFRWDQVSQLAILVERNHDQEQVHNPTQGGLGLDNIRLLDQDGKYPNLPAARDAITGGVRPEYRDAFLDYVRQLTFLYFLDFASTDARTGGLIQDRGTFADLTSVGGAGFQLSAYVIGAERGYLARTSAAARVEAILNMLAEHPQGTNRVGMAGYKGFFYHFLGIDGLRKQNFDFVATPDVDESLNTVELSTIDTALALMGVITAKQYFQQATPMEDHIRDLAQRIVGRVQWPFMLATLPSGARQMCLGWKPTEKRDDSLGRFLLPDGQGTGCFSSRPNTNGAEIAATLDYYTDEALIIALLGLAAPADSNRLPRAAWDDIARQGAGFVRTFPGSLFTYQFLSCWLDMRALGKDNHATCPTNFYDNTRQAIAATRSYAATNAGMGLTAWGLSACEGPYDDYAAEGAPTAALGTNTEIVATAGSHLLEGEQATCHSTTNARSNASAKHALSVTNAGLVLRWSFSVASNAAFSVALDYSNDGPPDTLAVALDGVELGRFETVTTGSGGGGWNNFVSQSITSAIWLARGGHTAQVTVVYCDPYGVEVDVVRLGAGSTPRPLTTGTLTAYGVGSSMAHWPDETLAALWYTATLDLTADGAPDVLHPRFGFADAFSLDISRTLTAPGNTNQLRRTGAWANPTGFAIDQGPMLIILDNYLGNQLVPRMFMSDTNIQQALRGIFEGAARQAGGRGPGKKGP